MESWVWKAETDWTRTSWNPSLFLTTSSLEVMADQEKKPVPFTTERCTYLAQDLKKWKRGTWLLLEKLQVQELPDLRMKSQLVRDNMQELPQSLTSSIDLQRVKAITPPLPPKLMIL